mgnify:CR=1 FL=1
MFECPWIQMSMESQGKTISETTMSSKLVVSSRILRLFSLRQLGDCCSYWSITGSPKIGCWAVNLWLLADSFLGTAI